MAWCLAVFCLLGLLPSTALASTGEVFDPPIWTAIPFVIMLLAIAVFPLFAEHFWQSNKNKALVAFLLSLPVILYLVNAGTLAPDRSVTSITNIDSAGSGAAILPMSDSSVMSMTTILERAGTQALLHEWTEYLSFIILLFSLYTVAGGIVLSGDIQARPLVNTGFLAFGAVLANLIGTTGASMLLIRPVLQTNQERRQTKHIPVFFIFLVGNLGGLLTPLGDPPLFLGFLKGVDFPWTFSLWPQWIVANGIILLLFLIWDIRAYDLELLRARDLDIHQIKPLRVRGLINLLFLAGILLAVVLQSPQISESAREFISRIVPCPSLTFERPWVEFFMLLMAAFSIAMTPAGLRDANGFSWGAIVEVAVLFAGIFTTMVPALAWLTIHGPEFGVSQPWQYFWLSGSLSSFLDNAPTYVTFATMAAGPHDFARLAAESPHLLQAISCGAVFMGANTYIGNGPNFMIKAIADQAGFKTPSFFGYMAYSGLILLPVFGLLTLLFFRS